MSNCHFWGQGRLPVTAKERMVAATEEWRGTQVGPLLGFLHLRAPNQVTGYLCKLFFDEKNRENVVNSVASMKDWRITWRREMLKEEKDSLREMLMRFSVIGRVVSCDSLIKVVMIPFYPP